MIHNMLTAFQMLTAIVIAIEKLPEVGRKGHQQLPVHTILKEILVIFEIILVEPLLLP